MQNAKGKCAKCKLAKGKGQKTTKSLSVQSVGEIQLSSFQNATKKIIFSFQLKKIIDPFTIIV
jgi:hypothetical protein